MEAEKVIELYTLLKSNTIPIILDGGWAVDALIGRQTRKHDDLDIALSHEHVLPMRKILWQIGFTDYPTNDRSACNFVLADHLGNKLDIHTFLFDELGNNLYGIEYQFTHFGGRGAINGQVVDCINPTSLVHFHTGYEVDEKDFHDVKLLCEKFDIPVPKDYVRF